MVQTPLPAAQNRRPSRLCVAIKGAFYNNWARMLDDDSPNGAVGCFVPHSPLSVGGAQMNYAGKGFAPANKSCDASWASAYPSAVYSVMRTVSRQIYPGT